MHNPGACKAASVGISGKTFHGLMNKMILKAERLVEAEGQSEIMKDQRGENCSSQGKNIYCQLDGTQCSVKEADRKDYVFVML